MEKYSITVYSEADACFARNMFIRSFPSGKLFRMPELHVGVNYTSDSQVYECAKRIEGQYGGIIVEPMGKKFDLRKEFSKFRFCEGMNVLLSDPSDGRLFCTLYFRNKELVEIVSYDGCKPQRKLYKVYVNDPYYENGENGLRVRKEESNKQHVFLETSSAKTAFNMVNRIVANMRYPKTKYIW